MTDDLCYKFVNLGSGKGRRRSDRQKLSSFDKKMIFGGEIRPVEHEL